MVRLAWLLLVLTSFHDNGWVLATIRQRVVVATPGELLREECTEAFQGGEVTALAGLRVL